MQYTIELIELWWTCLIIAMKDRSLAFPISAAVGAIAGGLFWWLAALSAKLWNRRFHLKVGLQILCGFAAFMALILALTFTSSRHMEDAVEISLNEWKMATVNDAEWKHEAFCDAWDAVAQLGQEADVRVEPSPRTDPNLNSLSMGSPESKKAVVRVYVSAAVEKFRTEKPYLYGIINPEAEIPQERLDASLLSWFRDNPGSAYPAEQGVEVLAILLEHGAKQQIEPVGAYTRRLTFAIFILTQILVFVAIAVVAHRSNRPATAK